MKWPIVPSILVVLAISTMVGLGIWQLQRKHEKEGLLVRYSAASGMPPTAWPAVPVPGNLPLFRKSSVMCVNVVDIQPVSGSSADGKAGFAHVATCSTGGGEGPGAKIAIGWSERPRSPEWKGGLVNGIIAPDNAQLIKLVATDRVPELQLLAAPSPVQIPNNHLLYAIQWFIFAAAAAIIYILAVRKRFS